MLEKTKRELNEIKNTLTEPVRLFAKYKYLKKLERELKKYKKYQNKASKHASILAALVKVDEEEKWH